LGCKYPHKKSHKMELAKIMPFVIPILPLVSTFFYSHGILLLTMHSPPFFHLFIYLVVNPPKSLKELKETIETSIIFTTSNTLELSCLLK
jgi:hypothetical protein